MLLPRLLRWWGSREREGDMTMLIYNRIDYDLHDPFPAVHLKTRSLRMITSVDKVGLLPDPPVYD